MKRGGRPARDRERRAAMVRILAAEPVLCLDCATGRFRVSPDGAIVELYHRPGCPALRSGWSARAADDYLRAVLIIGGMPLADYGDVTGAHRPAYLAG